MRQIPLMSKMTPLRRLRLLLITGLALSNGLVVLMSVYSLQQTWQQTQIRVEVQTQNVANAIDQSVSDSIDKIDLVLRGFVDDAEAQLQRGHLDEDAMRATMTRYEQRMPEVEYFRITDREGFVVVGNQVNKH